MNKAIHVHLQPTKELTLDFGFKGFLFPDCLLPVIIPGNSQLEIPEAMKFTLYHLLLAIVFSMTGLPYCPKLGRIKLCC